MKNIIPFLSIVVWVMFLSCGQFDSNNTEDEGTIKGDIYTNKKLGWTLQIPEGWTVITKEKSREQTEKGKQALEEVAGEIDYSGLKYLISFQKDAYTIFQSTSEPFELEYEGEWEENNEAIKEIIYQTYSNQGLELDTSSSSLQIDGLYFNVFHMTVYAPGRKVLLYQDMYNTYIKGFDFGVNLNYTNDEDKETMLQVLKNSKFEKE